MRKSGIITLAKNKSFWHSLCMMVIPIAIQNFFATAVTSADVLMLGYIGQDELSAVSLANQFQFLLIGLMFGINSGIVILASQYWGKKDTDSIQAIAGIALKFAVLVTGVITVGCIVCPKLLMTIYTNDTTLIEIGSAYLKLVGISYLLSSISQVYQSMLRSIERATLSTVISSSALALNIMLNAVFIFGLLGAPKLGVKGVAIATVISRVIELLLCAIDAIRGTAFKLKPSIILGSNRLLTGDFIKYSLPAILNDCSWTFAFSTYSIIMGHMNSDMVAASSVATTIRDLCTVVAYAFCNGSAVLLGIKIGENKKEEAKDEASLFCYIALVLGIITGAVILLIRPLIFKYYVLTGQAESYLNIMLIISSYYVVGQVMNTLLIAGIFRAGGNTRWGLICDTITMWVVSVPLGFISAFVLKLPPMAVYFILCLDEFWKIPFVYRYYKSGKWLRNITRDF